MEAESPFNSPTNLPWPQKGDILFTAADDWYHNACLNRHYDNWEMYAAGYKLAGDILVQHVIDKRQDRDTLVFPIVFNYRQYLELRCKEIISVGRILAGEDGEFPKTHNLKTLWILSRSILANGEPSTDESDLEAIDETIDQFCSVDFRSESFRYPVDRQGNSSLPEALHVINLRQLRDCMNRVASFFDGVTMAFSAYLDYKAEMQSAFWGDGSTLYRWTDRRLFLGLSVMVLCLSKLSNIVAYSFLRMM